MQHMYITGVSFKVAVFISEIHFSLYCCNIPYFNIRYPLIIRHTNDAEHLLNRRVIIVLVDEMRWSYHLSGSKSNYTSIFHCVNDERH